MPILSFGALWSFARKTLDDLALLAARQFLALARGVPVPRPLHVSVHVCITYNSQAQCKN
jgi:hypothetical protein